MQPDAPTTAFHADAHFRMGSAHEAEGTPCQDFALAETLSGQPFAIVSDGCSTSGRTDVGARLVALSARISLMDALRRGSADMLSEVRLGVVDRVARLHDDLELDLGDLDATLAAVVAGEDGGVTALLMGDGLAAARTAAGIEVAVADWAGNMPGYPLYLANPARMAAFVDASEAFGREARRPPFRISRFLVSPDGEAIPLSCEGHGAADGLRGIAVSWGAGTDVAAVMTDGVQQVGQVPWGRVVAELTAVKAARAGAFMARRMSRALGAMAKDGHRPVDDISVAALAAAR